MASRIVDALVDRQARERDRLEQRTLSLLARILKAFGARPDRWYSDRDVAAFAAQAARAVRAGQTQTGALTSAYLQAVLRDLGITPARAAVRTPQDLRAGITVNDEFARVAKTYRRAIADGKDSPTALRLVEHRVDAIARTDLALAARDASRQVLDAAGPRVTGYRRIIRPELSAGGTCGLCIVASDRVYKVADLLPIHDRCNCLTMPVVRYGGQTLDPGTDVNAADLKRLYAAAGSTAGEDLARIRVKVRQHGELGPLLTRDGHDFRTDDQAAADTAPRAA